MSLFLQGPWLSIFSSHPPYIIILALPAQLDHKNKEVATITTVQSEIEAKLEELRGKAKEQQKNAKHVSVVSCIGAFLLDDLSSREKSWLADIVSC